MSSFFNEDTKPYIYSAVLTLVLVLGDLILLKSVFENINKEHLMKISNIIIIMVLMVVGFVMTNLTIVLQNKNAHITMFKKNYVYAKFIRFFKEMLMSSAILIILSLFLTLGLFMNMFYYTLYFFFFLLFMFLNNRIVGLFKKMLKI